MANLTLLLALALTGHVVLHVLTYGTLPTTMGRVLHVLHVLTSDRGRMVRCRMAPHGSHTLMSAIRSTVRNAWEVE